LEAEISLRDSGARPAQELGQKFTGKSDARPAKMMVVDLRFGDKADRWKTTRTIVHQNFKKTVSSGRMCQRYGPEIAKIFNISKLF
jgi:hypothetical protein